MSADTQAPIERVKLLLQSQDEMVRTGRLNRPYKGIVDCFSRVIKEDGVRSLWRSNGTNVARYFPTQALNFAFKDFFKRTLKPSKTDSRAKVFAGNIASGGAAGVSSAVFTYSLDYARTRLANDARVAGQKGTGSARQFNGVIDVYRKTLASDGVAGLYRGFGISAIGIFIYRGLYFGLYDTVKLALPSAAQNNFLSQFALGWGVTNVASYISYPIDTIRRRMMMTSAGGVKYSSSMDCMRHIIKDEGWRSLFKGAGANVLRAVASAGVLAGYDQLQMLFLGKKFSAGSG